MDREDKDRSADERDRRDIEIINRNAERLNREALDTLGYQQLPQSAAKHLSRHA
jgi:hypothetical protein